MRQKQPNRCHLWLGDGSCVWLHAEHFAMFELNTIEDCTGEGDIPDVESD
jgi:hypothetical protein